MQESSTFQLVVAQGPRPGQVFELPRSTVSIGRDPGNQVVINDPQISRQHARITPQGGLMVLEDLGSTNGTMVNGLRISGPHTLAHGDQIGLGDNVMLTFYGRPVSDAGDTVGFGAVEQSRNIAPDFGPHGDEPLFFCWGVNDLPTGNVFSTRIVGATCTDFSEVERSPPLEKNTFGFVLPNLLDFRRRRRFHHLNLLFSISFGHSRHPPLLPLQRRSFTF